MRHSAARLSRTAVVAALAGALATTAAAAPGVEILENSPACVEQRLGRVHIALGDERPDPRRGGSVPSVSYRKAFDSLKQAALERGGNAVVLRDHRADYFTKGARRAPRPTYLALSGAAIRIDRSNTSCVLAVIDPVEFEREATAKERANVAKNAGVSF